MYFIIGVIITLIMGYVWLNYDKINQSYVSRPGCRSFNRRGRCHFALVSPSR